MFKNKIIIIKIIFAFSLIIIPITWRLLNHKNNFAPNLELITVSAVLAAIALSKQAAIIIPLTNIIISDLIIGNSSIFIFTWSSFLLIGICAIVMRKFNKNPKKQIVTSIGFAIFGSFMFFAITNFGVWAQGWYPATLAGLTTSYAMALPFYRTMLIGNIIIIPSAITLLQLAKTHLTTKSLIVNTFIGK